MTDSINSDQVTALTPVGTATGWRANVKTGAQNQAGAALTMAGIGLGAWALKEGYKWLRAHNMSQELDISQVDDILLGDMGDDPDLWDRDQLRRAQLRCAPYFRAEVDKERGSMPAVFGRAAEEARRVTESESKAIMYGNAWAKRTKKKLLKLAAKKAEKKAEKRRPTTAKAMGQGSADVILAKLDEIQSGVNNLNDRVETVEGTLANS